MTCLYINNGIKVAIQSFINMRTTTKQQPSSEDSSSPMRLNVSSSSPVTFHSIFSFSLFVFFMMQRYAFILAPASKMPKNQCFSGVFFTPFLQENQLTLYQSSFLSFLFISFISNTP